VCSSDLAAPTLLARSRAAPPRARPPPERVGRWASRPRGDGCEPRWKDDDSDEEDVPAQQPATSPSPRLPTPDVDARRSGDPPLPAPEGPAAALGVIHRVRGRSTFRAFPTAPMGRCGVVRARCLRAPEPRDVGSDSAVAYALGRRLGSAVARNRIRRRLRAAVDQLDRRGGVLLPSTAYLVSAGPEAATCSFTELLTWVEGALCNAATAAGGVP